MSEQRAGATAHHERARRRSDADAEDAAHTVEHADAKTSKSDREKTRHGEVSVEYSRYSATQVSDGLGNYYSVYVE